MESEENENIKLADENENKIESNKHNIDNKPSVNINAYENKDKNISSNDVNLGPFLLVCIIGVSLAILLEIINVQNRNSKDKEHVPQNRYWVYSAFKDVDNREGILKHVHLVLNRINYVQTTNHTDWNLLWSHDYPFRSLYPNLHKLKSHQKVNHFPGTGFITNKVDLATSESKYIPKAFKLPKNKNEFLEYASSNKDALFLQKHNQHRGIYLKNLTEIDFESGESFVQEFVQKPFLVDGHKFDIGVYVVITSVNPLRAYWYKGDVLFRYCPAKYYPFDPKTFDKYVIGDDYLPTWEVPSLADTYTALGYSMKNAFDIYASSKGKDITQMWAEVQNAISDILLKKEHHIIDALKHYPSSDNFFEMMRFDLVIDEDLKVYLLEANMSPNLSSAHFPPNQLLYEQVLYNLFSLAGVSTHLHGFNNNNRERTSSQNMVSSQKNIAVWGKQCSTICKEDCSVSEMCALCRPCISARMKTSLFSAHKEFLHRGDFRRLFPPLMEQKKLNKEYLNNLNEANRLQCLWYQGKCNEDITWCS